MSKTVSPLFSRILTVVFVLGCLAATFWIGAQVLAPVDVPPAPIPQSRVRFDTSVDVSRQPMFVGLEPLGPAVVDVPERGRMNPFAPVMHPSVTSTPEASATSSVVTSSLPLSTTGSISSP